MKVLFNTYSTAFQFPGGGEVILRKSKEYLEKEGVEVKLFDREKDRIADFDLVHNFSIAKGCLDVVSKANQLGKPIALHTIYWPQDEYARKGDIGFLLRMKKWLYTFINRHNLFGLSKMRKIMELSTILFPNSVAEAEMLEKEFKVAKEKIHVVHDGIDARFFDGNAGEFEKKFGLKDFVLYVGRIEPRKNVLSLVKAVAGTGMPLVIVGAADERHQPYYRECREAGDKNTKFVGRIEHNSSLLVSAYHAAKVLALPTWYETPGIVAMEAAAAGCNLVITDRGCTKEYFKGFAKYVSPDNIGQIRERLVEAFKEGRNLKLKEYARKNFSWEKVAKETIAGYRKAIKAAGKK